MSYYATIKKYLKSLQESYRDNLQAAQHTPELSYRAPMHELFKELAHDLNPESDIAVILEPRKQGTAGRPDWRVHNRKSLGIYGYIEAKGLSTDSFDTTPYARQIQKYLSLGHHLVITDGLDFIFCMNKGEQPTIISLIDKSDMTRRDWSTARINPSFEAYMRDFYKNPAPQHINESTLVELVAVRTRNLAEEIREHADVPLEEAIDESERQLITLLDGLKKLIYNHNDPRLRTGAVFADFTAQVVMFCLLYAHRVFCKSEDTPSEKEAKIKQFIASEISEDDALIPFRNVMRYLDNAENGGSVSQWIDECVKFLSFVQMTDAQLLNPDYHRLFELFLTKYNARVRLDYGAYYTPKILADFVVKLTNYLVGKNFNGASIYDDGNTIIDPCCGTGSFLEEIILQDSGDGAYNLCGFEILPAPYMLANYRMAIMEKTLGQRRHNTHIILANTLSNSVFEGNGNEHTIEGHELNRANKLSATPLRLIIGNPPSSDAIRQNVMTDFSIINGLMDDFRPPSERRRSRQNIQKQINNPYLQFLRWSCKKLLDSPSHAALSLVVPSSFLEAESYQYARKFLVENFSDAWVCSIDADARTGIRSDGIFNTLQGRALIILTRKFGESNSVTRYHFCDFSHMARSEKLRNLGESVPVILNAFHEYPLNINTFSFAPSNPFNQELYDKFWAISGTSSQKAVFINHCSGIKVAPTAMFTHIKSAMLKRRSKQIAEKGVSAAREWFEKQNRPPTDEKVAAFQSALRKRGDSFSIDRFLTENIKIYTFRPFLTAHVLLWTDLLRQFGKNGGARIRQEIIDAYADKNTVGFAMAHAPKDLNPTLSQFVSFCWYYPDNDMCTRGNSHIYMNQFPEKKTGRLLQNVNPELLSFTARLLNVDESQAAKNMVFYCFAVLCSQVYLDEFEGALNTVNQSDNRARIPIVKDAEVFSRLVFLGERLAELEKADYVPENRLGYDYKALMNRVPPDFHLVCSSHPFDEGNELLILSNGNIKIPLHCPLSLQNLNISGYDVIKNCWLKFYSYDFSHCSFTPEDMRKLLHFLNILSTHACYVSKVDNIIHQVLSGEVDLLLL